MHLFAGLTLISAITGPLTRPEDDTYTRNVAVLLYEGVVLLDFAGPSHVLEVAGRYGEHEGMPAFRLYTVSASLDPVTSQGFLKSYRDTIPKRPLNPMSS